MPITLPDSLGHRLAPFAMQLGLSVEEMAGQLLDDWLSWKEAEAALMAAVEGPLPAALDAHAFARIRAKLGLGGPGLDAMPAGATYRHAFLADVQSVAAQAGRANPADSEVLVKDVEETLRVLQWLPEVGEPSVGPTDVPADVRRSSLRTFRGYDIYYRTVDGPCELLRLLKRPAPTCPLTS